MIQGEDKEGSQTTKQECCICRAESPMTQTNYTLISSRHQWRMELKTDENGRKEPHWYCPTCWSRVKQVRQTGPSKGSNNR
jgi:hypothetical protein